MNLEQENQTHEKGEPTPNKKAVKASVVWTRPDRETRRRGPTERYGIVVVMRVDEVGQTDGEVVNKKRWKILQGKLKQFMDS